MTSQAADATSRPPNRGVQYFAIACGTIFTVASLVGWVAIAQGLQPVPAGDSPVEVARHFATHQTSMQLGCTIYIIGCAFFAVWIVQLGLTLRRIEGGHPVLSIAGALSGMSVIVFVVLSCCLWISASYRPDAAPDVVVALNDAGWIGFLCSWPALALQIVATAVVSLRDRRPVPLVPRWAAWCSIGAACVIAMAAGPAFAKTGPFAWNGALAYYLPMCCWAAWFESHSWFMFRALRRQEAIGARAHEGEARAPGLVPAAT